MADLLLETATDVCSVAIADGDRILAEVTATEPYRHASHLTVYVREALDRACIPMTDLREVVLSDGPGSYTSLRVGAATAKGLCLALPDLSFSVVSTLEALARAAEASGSDRILAVINSRRGEVFGQVFSSDSLSPETEVLNVRLTDPKWRGRLLGGDGLGRLLVCGPGQQRVREAIDGDNAFRFADPTSVAARYLLAPARRRPALAAYEPFYLNPPFVTKSKKNALR